MDALSSATTLTRVLVGLDRSEATGLLRLRGRGRCGEVSFEGGLIVGANLDRRIAGSEEHLLAGLRRVSDWDELVLRFTQGTPPNAWWRLRRPVGGAPIAMRFLCDAVAAMDPGAVRAVVGEGLYRLTKLGRALVGEPAARVQGALALCPVEQMAVESLCRGVPVDALESMPDCGLDGYRFACALTLVRAVTPAGTGSFPLLLRKRRELRACVSPRELLDLPETADVSDSRQALRRLVRDLHPDRFASSSRPELARASGEVVTALVAAEASLGSGAAD